MERCPTCQTPLDDAGACVTCAARAEGMVLMQRSDYASAREKLDLLADAGLSPEMERVPPASEREKQVPLWNLYVPTAEVEAAKGKLLSDWASTVDADEGAHEAVRRGAEQLNLDAGGEVSCPACGHTFVAAEGVRECPDCGLGLGGLE